MENKKGIKINAYLVALILILLIAAGVRLYFFSSAYDQPVWWDESEHLVMAKHIAFGTPTTGWNATREIFVPLIFSFFFKLFNSEAAVRFAQVLFSFGIVFMLYLVGKEIFNKAIGLMAAFMMSIFYLNLFFTMRFGLEIIAPFFALTAVYFFWKGYVKKEKGYFIILAAVFMAFAVMSSAKEALLLVSIFFFLLFTDKFRFFRNKKIWFAAIIFLVLLSPYMLYYFNAVGHPLPRLMTQTASVQARLSEGGWDWNNFFGFAKYFPTYLQLPFLLIFLLGLFFVLINLALGFDLMLKGQANQNHKFLFLIFWAALPLFTFSYLFGQSPGAYLEPRFMMEIFPAVFLITAYGFSKIYDWVKLYKKEFALGIVILLLLAGAFYQLGIANPMIKIKGASYLQVKEAAFWMKERSSEDDWIVTGSAPQTTYYAERQVFGVGADWDEEKFIQKVREHKPKFLVISVFEAYPEWFFSWPEQNARKVRPVQVYTAMDTGEAQPILVIYEFTSYDF